MNHLRMGMRRFSGLIIGLGLVAIPTAAFASGTAFIQSVSPGTTVTPGNEVSFQIGTNGFSSALSYSLSDSISGSATSANINANGVFGWIPTAADAGTHNFTITISDQSGNSAVVTQQIIVQGPPTLTVQSISPGSSLTAGQTLTFSAVPSGFASNPSYSVSDSFGGTTLNSTDINSNGGIDWTPQAIDTGTHTITVSAVDSSGNNASVSQTITVNPVAGVSLQSVVPGTSLTPGQALTFVATANGFTSPIYTVSDSYSGSTVSNADINASGAFSWTPSTYEVGAHTLTIYASDAYGHTGNTTLTVNVGSAPATTTTVPTQPSGLTQSQIQAILSLLQNFGADQNVINNVSATLNGTQTTTAPAQTGDGYVFSNFLDVGTSGTDVTELQTRLTVLGIYSGPITGFFGSLTQAAVEAFQSAHGIEAVGYVGPATRAALNE